MQIIPCSCLGSIYRCSVPAEVVQSIDSLHSSDLVPEQIILIVDGPIPDELHRCLAALLVKYSSLSLVELAENVGLGLALREGLAFCRHDVVIRFDTDDISVPWRLAYSFGLLASDPNIHVLGGQVCEFIPTSSVLASLVVKDVPIGDKRIKKALDYRNPVNHPSVAFRKSLIQSIGSYEHCPFFEDYLLWLKARRAGLSICNLPVVLVCMRRSSVLDRRSGFGYFRAEVFFFLLAFRRHLLPLSALLVGLLRAVSRLLPMRLQLFQNLLPWRSSAKIGMNPEFLHAFSLFGSFPLHW